MVLARATIPESANGLVTVAPKGTIGRNSILAMVKRMLDPMTLAEAQDVLQSGWPALIGQLGVVGALVWYLWYRTSVADPKRDAEVWQRIDAMTARHETNVTKTVEAFDEALTAERTARREEIVLLKDAFRCKNQ